MEVYPIRVAVLSDALQTEVKRYVFAGIECAAIS